MSTSIRGTLATAGFALALAGCGTAEPVGGADPLRAVEIPEGFTFATTQALTVTVHAGVTVIPSGGKLVISRRGGAVVYSGALLPDRPLSLELMVPTADRDLVVKLEAEHATWAAELVAEGPTATVTFEEDS